MRVEILPLCAATTARKQSHPPLRKHDMEALSSYHFPTTERGLEQAEQELVQQWSKHTRQRQRLCAKTRSLETTTI